jgi:hypothetical protein
MNTLSNIFELRGDEIILSTKITSVTNKENTIIIFDNKNEWEFDLIYNCAGLYSDRNYKNFTHKKRPL